jgi:O-antigen/teichoic acid export membrane protein
MSESRPAKAMSRLRRSRFVRDVGAMWTAHGLAMVVAVVQGIVVARILGPASYGIVGLVIAVPALVFTFLDARSADAGFRYLGEFAAADDHHRARAFAKLGLTLDLGVGAVSFLIVVLAAPWAAMHVVRDPSVAGLIVVAAAGSWLRVPVFTSEAVLATLGRYRLVGGIRAGGAIARAILLVVVAVAGMGVVGVVWASAIGFAGEGLAAAVITGAAVRRSWGGGLASADLGSLRGRGREIARFLVWSDVGSTLGLAAKQLDVVLVGALGGQAAAGFYRLATSIGALFSAAVQPLQSVLAQRFSGRRGAGDETGLREVVRGAATHVCLPVSLVALACIPLIPTAIRWTAGSDYLPATDAATILAVASIVWLAFAWARPLALATDEVRVWTGASVVIAAVSLLGFVVAIPAAGAAGAAWVRLLTGALFQASMAIYLWRRHIARRPTGSLRPHATT